MKLLFSKNEHHKLDHWQVTIYFFYFQTLGGLWEIHQSLSQYVISKNRLETYKKAGNVFLHGVGSNAVFTLYLHSAESTVVLSR